MMKRVVFRCRDYYENCCRSTLIEITLESVWSVWLWRNIHNILGSYETLFDNVISDFTTCVSGSSQIVLAQNNISCDMRLNFLWWCTLLQCFGKCHKWNYKAVSYGYWKSVSCYDNLGNIVKIDKKKINLCGNEFEKAFSQFPMLR